MNYYEHLNAAGAVYRDYHFVYQSGKHGPHYVNADKIFTDLELVKLFCEGLAWPFKDDGIEVVVAPATGGIILSVLTALTLDPMGVRVAAIWADNQNKVFSFDRAGFVERVKGRQVLVVDDTMTNDNPDGTAYKVCRLVEDAGGIIVGASIICNRCNGTAQGLRIERLESLVEVDFTAVPADECELCRQGVPIIADIGHGGEYKRIHPNYPGSYIKLL